MQKLLNEKYKVMTLSMLIDAIEICLPASFGVALLNTSEVYDIYTEVCDVTVDGNHMGTIVSLEHTIEMFEHADEHMHEIFLARDGYMGNKEYASCEEHEEVAELLLHRYVKAEPCNLYELIRDGNQCKLYADVEWHGPSNDNHNARLDCFLNKIKSSVQVRLSLYILIF